MDATRRHLHGLSGGASTAAPVIPDDLDELMRPHLWSVASEVEDEICGEVPEYAWTPNSHYGRRMRQTIIETVALFIESGDRRDLLDLYGRMGAHEARRGGGVERLQTALRVGGRVGCRRLVKDAYRLGWSRDTLAGLIDSLLCLLDELAAAADRGYARERQASANQAEEGRARLRDLIVQTPPATAAAVEALAKAVRWQAPSTVGIVAIKPYVSGRHGPPAILSPALLADWSDEGAFVVVPDPDSPGQRRHLASLAALGSAALGPTVPLTEGAASLRWARRALDLVEQGVLSSPEGNVLHCTEHVTTLVATQGEDLLHMVAARRLAPLLELPRPKRTTLMSTMLTYLECGENAPLTARRMCVHHQTVRYRLNRLRQLCGDEVFEPGQRLDLMLLLHAHLSRPDSVLP